MNVKLLTLGALYTNCYIVGCSETKEALVIDPGFSASGDAEQVLGEIEQQSLNVKYIVNTHGHPDHIEGNKTVKDATDALILIHELDSPMLGTPAGQYSRLLGFQAASPPADRTLREGETVRIGHVQLRVLHTPGHSRGSIALLGEDAVFTGDTLFAGSIGRYDLPGGSYKEIMNSIRRLTALPDHLVVYPGHGPTSLIRVE
ncbi:MAG: MBL fold metallo-hydrolase, partial [Candidatus Bathyarchaeota archaeon]